MDAPVTTERLGNVDVIHLDDGKVNAVSFALAASITDAIRSAEADGDVNAVVLHGRLGTFSAGFDLSVVGGGDADAARQLVADGGQLVHTLYSAKVPVVAACTGHAIAAGALMLCGCDYRVGPDTDAKIAMNEVAIGMALPDWAITVLSERLTETYLQRSAVLGETFTPARAVAAGFLDELVDADEVLDRAITIAAQLGATLDPKSHIVTKRRLRGAVLARLQTEVDEFRATGEL